MESANESANSPVAPPLEAVAVEEKKSARALPDAAYVAAVVRRNLLLALAIVLAYAPFGALFALRAGSTYDSSVILRYDLGDALDSDAAASRANFAVIIAFMQEKLKDLDYMQELAARYFTGTPKSLVNSLPLPSPIKRALLSLKKPPNADAARLGEARSLVNHVAIIPDTYAMQTAMVRLTSTAGSAEDAQRLASVAGQLLIDMYYAEAVKRATAKKRYLMSMMANPTIREMVEKASRFDKAPAAASSEERQSQMEVRQRQHRLQEQIKDISITLTALRAARTKLETDITEQQLRYGPFHPTITALKRQLEEMKHSPKEKSLADEMSALQEKSLALETMPGGAVSIKADASSLDKVMQDLPGRMDRSIIEQLSLEQQAKDPNQRLHLTLLGEPTLPPEATSSKRSKSLMIAVIVGLVLALVTVVAKEALSDAVKDPWRVNWKYQLRCLANIPRKVLKAQPVLEPDAIRAYCAQLAPGADLPKSGNPLLHYRRITHWLHTAANGRVLLVLKSSAEPRCAGFINNLVNVMACDYAGRCLVVDFDSRDAMPVRVAVGGGHIVDYLSRKATWKDVCRPRDGQRAYDLVAAPATLDARLSELISSPTFHEFMASARKSYKTIVMIGVGAEQFVENTSLLDHATDCLVLVEKGKTSFRRLSTHLKPLQPTDKMSGFVYLDVPT